MPRTLPLDEYEVKESTGGHSLVITPLRLSLQAGQDYPMGKYTLYFSFNSLPSHVQVDNVQVTFIDCM